MSKTGRSPKLKMPEVVERVGLKTFEGVGSAVLELVRSGKDKFEISVSRYLVGVTQEDMERITKEFQIDDSTVESILSSLAEVFRRILTRETERIAEGFGKDKKSVEKAKQVVDIGRRLIQKYPQVRDRFLITSSTKTQYLEDLDWEVCIKAAEHPFYDFSKEDRFTTCTLRFILSKAVSPLYPEKPRAEVTDAVFDVSLTDVNRLIAALTLAGDRMKEVEKEIKR